MFVKIVKFICRDHEILLVLMVLVPLWATTPILSALADGSLGYNDQIWWHLSCIFLNYACVEWTSDTRTNKPCFVIANQIWINRIVHALCFVDICSKYAKVIQDGRIYFEARWRQLFEVNDAVSGGVILSILTGRMPVWMWPLLRVTVQHINLSP